MERAYLGGSNLLHLSLDTIVAAVFYQLPRRSPQLRRNAAPYLLRGLICKLYGVGKGNLWAAQVRASQSALASDLGVSRQWTNELIQRLVTAGWLRYHAPRLPDGHFEVGFFKIGPQLQRVLCALLSFRRAKARVNAPRQSFPTKEDVEKNLLFLRNLQKELAEKLSQQKKIRW
jgi:DNA-binding Lrp family transcriptional regulator